MIGAEARSAEAFPSIGWLGGYSLVTDWRLRFSLLFMTSRLRREIYEGSGERLAQG
jgi:hypothetical protein